MPLAPRWTRWTRSRCLCAPTSLVRTPNDHPQECYGTDWHPRSTRAASWRGARCGPGRRAARAWSGRFGSSPEGAASAASRAPPLLGHARHPRERACATQRRASRCTKTRTFPLARQAFLGPTLRVESRRKGHPSTCVARVHIAHVSITTIYAYGQGWGAQVAARRAQYRQRGAHAHIETHALSLLLSRTLLYMRRTGPVCTTRQVPRAIYIAQRARTRSCNVLAV